MNLVYGAYSDSKLLGIIPDVRRSHLREAPVEPLEGPVQVHLDPARRRRHRLPPVLRAPTLDKAHPDGY